MTMVELGLNPGSLTFVYQAFTHDMNIYCVSSMNQNPCQDPDLKAEHQAGHRVHPKKHKKEAEEPGEGGEGGDGKDGR